MVEDEIKEIPPSMTSPEWTPWVLSKFTPEEIFDGRPKVGGLRRVAEMLLGEIVENFSFVNKSPTKDDPTATVTATIVFQNVPLEEDDYDWSNLRRSKFSDSGDCSPQNTDGEYALYPVAMASTRAEAKALRKALRLQGIVSADEMKSFAPKPERVMEPKNLDDPEEFLTSVQVLVIKKRCNELGIDYDKLGFEIGRTSNQDGKQLLMNLNLWSNDKSLIPANLLP